MKRPITLTIDDEVYLTLAQRRLSDPDFNASELVNEALKAFFEAPKTKDMSKITSRLKEVEHNIKKLKTEKINLSTAKIHLEKKERKNEDIKTNKRKSIIKGVKASGILEEAFK